ncbi:DUF6452 family protein [Xylanibacter ruminicola]|jgi:hypothetical protein|uniref:Lipoprotein n=1 Tax=Xylanibacter ruminicola TaxID=839 RepID=A0A1M6YKS7_XYLRU|nr:DUF6452 family protein [Xylanibacter ruminicola]SHL18848.1 hypothetical protein SAMN05216463_12918 [Xylanibacter ruminicola]
MMKRLTYLLLGVVMAACSSIDCPVQSTVATLYQVCDSTGTQMALSDTMTVVSARQDGTEATLIDGQDATLYNKGFGLKEFTLPISYKHPEDVLVFHFDNSNNKDLHVTDTVWIKKEDYPHFESVDCSAAFFHTITDVKFTRHYIDSIVIKNPSVTYDSQTVHFYLYPKSSN